MQTATQERIHTSVETRAVNTTDLTVDIIASTDALDSYNSRIDAAGWNLEQFKRNPQILYAHDDRGFTASAGLPVARALPETVRVEGNKLLMRIQFTPKEVNDFGYKVFLLIAEGFLNGLSVGFEAIEWTNEEKEDGDSVRVYKRQKLLEVSIVTIPANDETLIVRRSKALNREEDADKFRTMLLEVETRAKEMEEEEDDEPEEDDEDEPTDENVKKWRKYYKNKQPVNKLASRALKKFFTKVLDEELPADEKEAWKRMTEGIDAMEPSPEEIIPAPVAEDIKTETPAEAAPTEPIIPTPSAEAPQAERKAFVQVPFSLLSDLPSLTRAYTEAGVEALRRGLPVKDALSLIDGMNNVVVNSFPTSTDGTDS